MKRKCPTCARQFADAAEVRGFRPFCSQRCRAADLGKWLDGGYRIEAPLSEEDLDQGLPTDGNPEPTQ
ncbi:MAG TPA: DNA gyrase inhibitor YacG [Polyangia bacterium]